MIILVTGGRAFNDREFVFASLDNLAEDVAPETIEAVIHGNAQGADKLADAWCLSRGVQPIRCPALFQKIPDAAKYRNRIMARLKPDLVVAFPGKSGTFDMIGVARRNKIEVVKPEYF
jgi:hypothetical protein